METTEKISYGKKDKLTEVVIEFPPNDEGKKREMCHLPKGRAPFYSDALDIILEAKRKVVGENPLHVSFATGDFSSPALYCHILESGGEPGKSKLFIARNLGQEVKKQILASPKYFVRKGSVPFVIEAFVESGYRGAESRLEVEIKNPRAATLRAGFQLTEQYVEVEEDGYYPYYIELEHGFTHQLIPEQIFYKEREWFLKDKIRTEKALAFIRDNIARYILEGIENSEPKKI